MNADRFLLLSLCRSLDEVLDSDLPRLDREILIEIHRTLAASKRAVEKLLLEDQTEVFVT